MLDKEFDKVLQERRAERNILSVERLSREREQDGQLLLNENQKKRGREFMRGRYYQCYVVHTLLMSEVLDVGLCVRCKLLISKTQMVVSLVAYL